MSQRPPIVSANGDINIHVEADLDINIAPAVGTYAGRTLKFKIIGTSVAVTLTAHPTNAAGKRILVPVATLQPHGRTVDFAVVDETGGNKTLWSGKLVRYA